MIETLWLVLFIVTCFNFAFSLIRTFVGWKTLAESRQYWGSWKERQADVARKIIEGMSDDEIVQLLDKFNKVKENGKSQI